MGKNANIIMTYNIRNSKICTTYGLKLCKLEKIYCNKNINLQIEVHIMFINILFLKKLYLNLLTKKIQRFYLKYFSAQHFITLLV